MEKWEYWKDEKVKKRFLSKVQVGEEDQCWLWRAGRFATGYGQFTINRGGQRKTLRAHRVAWTIDNQCAIPEGLVCAHSCDQPLCVNPSHLRITSQAKNVREAIERKRFGASKLTAEDVRMIRALYAQGMTQRELAERFGVGQTTISAVVRGASWAHLEGVNTAPAHSSAGA